MIFGKKTNVGRPKLPDSEKQKYQRLAVFPETHQVIKEMANESESYLIDWFEMVVEVLSENEKVKNQIRDRLLERKRKLMEEEAQKEIEHKLEMSKRKSEREAKRQAKEKEKKKAKTKK